MLFYFGQIFCVVIGGAIVPDSPDNSGRICRASEKRGVFIKWQADKQIMFKIICCKKKKRYLYLLNRVTGSTSVRRNKNRALTLAGLQIFLFWFDGVKPASTLHKTGGNKEWFQCLYRN